MADWYDGPPHMSIGEAMACSPRMPPKPNKPKWENTKALFTCPLGEIYELVTLGDAIMHTHTMSGHCFVWNRPNSPWEEGFRKYTFRSPDGWARVSIQARTLATLIDGSGSRMYCGNWRTLAEDWGAREVVGEAGKEAIVLLDFDAGYFSDFERADAELMKQMVLKWYKGLPEVDIPVPTEEEKSRKIVYGYGYTP